ncbi:MAG: quinone oxidoreductase, partial [Deltaproteobacteria bacterium]|nr:quinone oxidoreductase [Deltaproteobacteria bacterium]
MTKAIRIHETGGPELLKWEDVDVGSPGAGEVRLRHTAIGLNFIDVYHRTGLYPAGDLPKVLGMEGAGVVEDVGEGVLELAPGDRVAYAGVPMGAYAEARLMPEHRLVKLPEGIDDVRAAAMMLKGMTARYLLRRCYPLRSGETILVHAAAGGVGLIVCQWANHIGATVIGTVGSQEKAELARKNGCHYSILYREENFVGRVREITGNEGVSVVYDSVGLDTFQGSLDCLRPTG